MSASSSSLLCFGAVQVLLFLLLPWTPAVLCESTSIAPWRLQQQQQQHSHEPLSEYPKPKLQQQQELKRSTITMPSPSSSLLVVLRGGAAPSSKGSVKYLHSKAARTPSSRLKTPIGTSKGGGVTPASSDGGAPIPYMIFNLVKSIVGAGVLGLPAGVAAFGSTKLALVPSIALISVIGMLSAYCFSLIGRICAYTSSVSYRQAWERSVSSKSSWIPALACFMVTSCSVLAYSMILSDTIPTLLSAFTPYTVSRTQALLGVTFVALLPLCLMKSLKALGPFSLVGIIGMIYTSLAMALRYFDGSYREGGQFLETLSANLAPNFAEASSTKLMDLITNPKIFILVSMLSTAYMAHYNASKFYWELQNNTLKRYQTVVGTSFGISLLLFVAVAFFGFATFGTNCAGLVLQNYSTSDSLMSLSRIAVALSILFSYPLAFVGVRDGILDLIQVPQSKRSNKLLNVVTVVLLSTITSLAYVLKDLRTLLAFNGATWGNAVIYLLPTYMFVSCVKTKLPERKELQAEIPWVIATGVIGLCMGIVGTVLAIQG